MNEISTIASSSSASSFSPTTDETHSSNGRHNPEKYAKVKYVALAILIVLGGILLGALIGSGIGALAGGVVGGVFGVWVMLSTGASPAVIAITSLGLAAILGSLGLLGGGIAGGINAYYNYEEKNNPAPPPTGSTSSNSPSGYAPTPTLDEQMINNFKESKPNFFAWLK